MTLDWIAREPPLEPCAAVARGPARARLIEALLRRADLEGLSGVAGTDVVIVIGAAEELPWVDGVVYLGRDPAAPAVLLPTALAPAVPVDLLQGAVLARCAEGSAPVAVLRDPAALVPTGAARPLARHRLEEAL